jgi:primosomal protein DnaI
MKSAQAQIRQMLSGRRIKSADERLRELMEHTLIRAFQKENQDIPAEEYRRVISKLTQYVREQGNCAKCTGLETCGNLMAGHCSELVGYETYIDVKSKKCHRLEAYEEKQKRQQLMKSHKIPKSVLAATFDTIDIDQRADVIAEAIEYCGLFAEKGTPSHGLYLYGPFGTGKSHIAGAMANYLAALGVDSFMVYVPDFVQEVYNSIRNNTVSQLTDAVKNVKVLILDDIGAENLNPWMRDEIIGSILQHRMGEELPTIFTSNLTLNELEEHFSSTAKGGVEKKKAMRIMERIRHYVKPLPVTGRNRRRGQTT